ncbi:SFT2D2 family protein [Megaselia abdita]
MDKLRQVLSGRESNEEEESGILHQVNQATTLGLDWSTRIQAFACCFLLGIFCSVLASISFFLHRAVPFGILYTLGNILQMSSTCFLMGPVNQLKKMFASTRIIATIVVLVSIVLTLVCALVFHKPGLVLLMIIVQSLAMTWYSLSYIPYARDLVKKTFSTVIEA